MQDKAVELYGGAMRTRLPLSFVDVSQYSVTPDHQEVYADQNTECKLIFELTERSTEVSKSQCASYFFNDLATANGSSRSSILSACSFEPRNKWMDVVTNHRVEFTQWSNFSKIVESMGFSESAQSLDTLLSYPEFPYVPFPLVDSICHCVGEQEIKRLNGLHIVRVNMSVIRLAPPVNTDIIITLYSPRSIENCEQPITLLPDTEVDSIVKECLGHFQIVDWSLFVGV
ncbi:Ran-binding protein [Perkinsela sp. CCAP 1560/4]|nr:Ran-binding protein [Perkinsela sp. CCAP 1560/4]|eukprot:KNH05872.1 Ran-binding protein [Perkinsela sp. CCAP 1560/4]